ncbi:hypothetical protein Nepgr_013838 [Nepenthes gracilis]|uniref:CCT domain-containing protein n=1 Tax=Nepenthes gracilis TaxID=150966 RepID=A0AAD3XP04_NEPGR|nr:hypothetical protein Nepgr_013838 [Nepenthes gracilis]
MRFFHRFSCQRSTKKAKTPHSSSISGNHNKRSYPVVFRRTLFEHVEVCWITIFEQSYFCSSTDKLIFGRKAVRENGIHLTLVCERCNSHPAFVRCLEENVSLCQHCDWMGHGGSTCSPSHKKQSITSYSGCPSAAELSTIWSFILDLPLPTADDLTCEQGFGLMSIEEKSVRTSADTVDKDSGIETSAAVGVNHEWSTDKPNVWTESSSMPKLSVPQYQEQPALSENRAPSKMQPFCLGSKGVGIFEDDPYADLDMDEIDLNFDNYEELFGVTLTHCEQLLENGGIDSLFGLKDLSTDDSNCEGVLGFEGPSIGSSNALLPACSNAASADSIMSIKTEPNLGFASRQAHSTVSFSGLTGESNGGDYQDCGASSMLLLGEPPWFPPCPESFLPSVSRKDAVMRYKEKKKTRKFEKRVRYASRKERADIRKRVKGRFVKAGDAYDYDPLSKTRSC